MKKQKIIELKKMTITNEEIVIKRKNKSPLYNNSY